MRGFWGNKFTNAADWVSEFMGTPLNIAVWAFVILIWFWIFAIDPKLQTDSFLPAWFTSNAFNFPLNTVTTLAELFIGFLIAAAANRVEKRNTEMLNHIERLVMKEEQEIGEVLKDKSKIIYGKGRKTTRRR